VIKLRGVTAVPKTKANYAKLTSTLWKLKRVDGIEKKKKRLTYRRRNECG